MPRPNLIAKVLLSLLAALPVFTASSAVAQTPAEPEPESVGISVIELLSRRELHRWERHIRGFRREHNFALSTGISSGTWKVKRFGSIENKSYENTGIFSKFQYTFHLQWIEGFGYLLGSSTGYHYETADRRSDFRPVDAMQYPGVVAGLVYNFNPVLRILTTLEAYLERHTGIEENDDVDEDRKIFVTLQAYDAGMFIDVFYDLAWGIRLEGHKRQVYYKRPYKSEGFPVDAEFSKTDQWLGLGLVYHLL
jgi:hypothetical protein